jgi:hypothetical protein
VKHSGTNIPHVAWSKAFDFSQIRPVAKLRDTTRNTRN